MPAGRVDAKGGDYADARSKGTAVTLLATESSGALSHCTVRLIRRLATHVATPEGHDATAYGLSPSSPQSFYSLPPPSLRHFLRHCAC